MTESSQVLIKTNFGPITIELDGAKAPTTVKNFLHHVNQHFYEQTLFHRVIPGFMIQGGGFNTDFVQKNVDDTIKNEADNGLKNVRGSIAMARTSEPHSASTQFFINLVNNGFLDHSAPTPQGWGYAVFGKVIDGMDVVDDIARQKTAKRDGHADVPVDNIVIESITVLSDEANVDKKDSTS